MSLWFKSFDHTRIMTFDSLTRRSLLSSAGLGFGSIALNSLLQRSAVAAGNEPRGLAGFPHHPPKVRRVI